MKGSNIHSPDALDKAYAGRDWRAYASVLGDCVAFGVPGPILDIGAGLGFFLETCARWGISATGLEGSEYAIRRAQERCAGLDIRLHDLAAPWPFDKETFGAVLLNQTIEHLEPELVRRSLGEAWRVLLPEGVLIVNSPCYWNSRERQVESHINLYTPSRLRKEVSAAGFVRYQARDSAVRVKNRLVQKAVSGLWRLCRAERLTASANCIAWKPRLVEEACATPVYD